jgi:hypothetical protein
VPGKFARARSASMATVANGSADLLKYEGGAYSKYADWDLQFDDGGKGGAASEQQRRLVLECKEQCQQLLSLVSMDLLKFEHRRGNIEMSSKATVGLMLKGTVVDNLLMGGPAFTSGLIMKGDVILAVDGKEAKPEDVHIALQGNDTPGSPVKVSAQLLTCSPKVKGGRVRGLPRRDPACFLQSILHLTPRPRGTDPAQAAGRGGNRGAALPPLPTAPPLPPRAAAARRACPLR